MEDEKGAKILSLAFAIVGMILIGLGAHSIGIGGEAVAIGLFSGIIGSMFEATGLYFLLKKPEEESC